MPPTTTPAQTPLLRYPRVLSIAGSDSGGGAGIQADLKTFSALGCYGMTAITALTAQNTQGVRSIHGVPAAFLKEQLAAVIEDIGVDAVKIGMLHAPDVVEAVAWAIEHYQLRQVVLDPVMVATSGDALIEQRTIAVLVERLFPLVSVITPNMDEASLLLGRPVKQAVDLEAAAADLLGLGAKAVLLKGGHLQDDVLTDVLAQASQSPAHWLRLQGPRIASHNVHGTGCTLSSAIAAYLALGHSLEDAVKAAHKYIRGAIEAGANVTTGHGHGPLNHGFAPVGMQILSI